MLKTILRKIKNLPKIWWFKYLILGILIRVVLMPITVHPDLWGHSFTAYFFAYQGKLNIYDFLLSLPFNHPLVANYGVSDIFIYPPLTYFTLGIFRVLVKPFVDPNFIPWLMSNLGNVYSYSKLGVQLFFFKLPYLFLDLGLGFILSNLFMDEGKKKKAFILWIFNPLTLYATFMMGQMDILPVFFALLGLYFAFKEKPELAVLSLGIGGSYKEFPLLFIIPCAFYLAQKFWPRIKLIALGFLPFIVTIAPYLSSPGFRSMVLFSPKNQKMLFMQLPVSGAEGLFIFLVILTFIYLLAYYTHKRFSIGYYFIAILLLIFSVTHFHPQWFLWVTPFLIWELVENNFKHLLLAITLLLSWFLIILFFEPSLSIGLFSPLFHGLEKARGLTDILSPVTDVFRLKSMIRSVFAGASLFYCLRLFGLFKSNNE